MTKDFCVRAPFFDLAVSVDCGQSFRWEKRGEFLHGVAFGKAVDVKQTGDILCFLNTDEEDFAKLWKPYFSLDTDYEAICAQIGKDSRAGKAISTFPGIRILRQEPWEALCSFIISQNNNIPRIKGIIQRLCAMLGDDLGNGDYSFPSPEKILSCSLDGLAPIRSGFRAKYIMDAAEKVSRGEIDFEKIKSAPLQEANDMLKCIKGVGDKVARCTLLYGFNRLDAFPVDVWVKRILELRYPDGLPECFNGYRGVAQQYLFHYERTVNDSNG